MDDDDLLASISSQDPIDVRLGGVWDCAGVAHQGEEPKCRPCFCKIAPIPQKPFAPAERSRGFTLPWRQPHRQFGCQTVPDQAVHLVKCQLTFEDARGYSGVNKQNLVDLDNRVFGSQPPAQFGGETEELLVGKM